jgi:hypothetical protein
MRVVETMAFQGDVMFRRVTAVPPMAKQEEHEEPLIVAHSETGHHHVVQGGKLVTFFRESESTCYLRLEGGPADVVHLHPTDTHETLRLSEGMWQVVRQREMSPWGERLVED